MISKDPYCSPVLWFYGSMRQDYIRVRETVQTLVYNSNQGTSLGTPDFLWVSLALSFLDSLGRIESSPIWRPRLGVTNKKAWVFHLTSLSFNHLFTTPPETSVEVLYVDVILGVAE